MHHCRTLLQSVHAHREALRPPTSGATWPPHTPARGNVREPALCTEAGSFLFKGQLVDVLADACRTEVCVAQGSLSREPSSIAQQASPGQAFAGRTDIDPEVVCQQIRVARLWRMRPAPFRTYHECANSLPVWCNLVRRYQSRRRALDLASSRRTRSPASPAPRRSRNLGLSTWACHVRPKRQLPPRPSSRQVNWIRSAHCPLLQLAGGR